MFQKLKDNIENKRENKDIFSKSVVFTKDVVWAADTLIRKLIEKVSPNDIIYFNFALTYKCNSRCKTCNIWKRYIDEPEKVKEELTLEEIKRIFSSKYFKNLKLVGFTGGEVFLRDDLVELAGFFIRKFPNAHIGIPTNALKPDLAIKTLKEIIDKYNPRKKLGILVSIDGIGKTHDKIRGVPGNYKKVIKLINELKKMPRVDVGIGFTLIPENFKELLKVYELARKKKVKFGFWFGQMSDCYYENPDKKQEFKWTNGQLKELQKKIKKILKEDKDETLNLTSFHEYYYLNMVKFKKSKKRKINCYSGTHSFFLDAYGDLYPCTMLNREIGNVKEGFDKVWMSNKAKQARKFIKKRKCFCWSACEIWHSLEKNNKLIFFDMLRIFKKLIKNQDENKSF